MYEQQLDLFSSAGAEAERSLPLSSLERHKAARSSDETVPQPAPVDVGISAKYWSE
jgi:hypothetical protein